MCRAAARRVRTVSRAVRHRDGLTRALFTRALCLSPHAEILVHRASGLDWADALMRVMPERRGATARSEAPAEAEQQEDEQQDDEQEAVAGGATEPDETHEQ